MADSGDADSRLARLLAVVEAQGAKLDALTTALTSGGLVRRSTKTLREAYVLFEATWADQSWAKQMKTNFKPALRHFGDRPADEITRADWLHLRDNIRAKEPTIRKDNDGNNTLPSAYYLNQEMKRWRSFYRWAVAEGHCFTNPLLDLKGRRGAKKHRHTRPSEEEVVRILVACSPRQRAFVIVGARTGMRASEVRTLRWKNVDLESGRIKIEWQIAKSRKERFVPLTSDCITALNAIKPDIAPRCVFESPMIPGHPLVSSTLWQEFRATVDGLGIEAAAGDGRVVYHDLRHTFASWAAERLPLPVVAALGGWSDLRTMSRYIQVSDSEIAAAQATLEKAVRRGPQRSDRADSTSTTGDLKVSDR